MRAAETPMLVGRGSWDQGAQPHWGPHPYSGADCRTRLGNFRAQRVRVAAWRESWGYFPGQFFKAVLCQNRLEQGETSFMKSEEIG